MIHYPPSFNYDIEEADRPKICYGCKSARGHCWGAARIKKFSEGFMVSYVCECECAK